MKMPISVVDHLNSSNQQVLLSSFDFVTFNLDKVIFEDIARSRM